MRIVFDAAYLLAAVAFAPVVLYRAIRHGRYRTGWRQRFGQVDRRDPSRRCIWLHAVSVGEVNASKTLVTELERRCPDCEIVISTTTDTGFARAREVFGEKSEVFYFPVDMSGITKRAFDRLKPQLCLLMELEIWPNFIETAHRRGVPVVVVNGRISDRSFPSYRRARPLLRRTFSRLTLALVQTEAYAERFRSLGCPSDRVVVTGSLKFDTAQKGNEGQSADTLAGELGLGDELLWVAGGTGDGEEHQILDAYKRLRQDPRLARLRLAIVPRKPERFDEVAGWIEQEGLPLLRYSRIKLGKERAALGPDTVILGDTMGDLRRFYGVAAIIFVGRSLVPMGGSDMMEAAALARPTLFGPHTFNFRQAVELLLSGQGAIEVRDGEDLRQTVARCLLEPEFSRRIAENGRRVIQENQGATARTLDRVLRLLGPSENGCRKGS
jgi:3-deoxy-D-manno-octulosonic-acid transferase